MVPISGDCIDQGIVDSVLTARRANKHESLRGHMRDQEHVVSSVKQHLAPTRSRSLLGFLGDTPSRMRCRALRLLASTLQWRGNLEAALVELNAAIGIAVMIRDPIEEASALAEAGTYALQDGHFARVEERFRAALGALSSDDLPYLRAALHHQLALALHKQQKSVDEAEKHAASALALRWDPQSRLATAERELLARIRARATGSKTR